MDEDPDRLETSALIAACLGGSREDAERLCAAADLPGLARASARALAVHGLSPARAARLAAAFALGRRVAGAARPERPSLRTPSSVHQLLLPDLRGLDKETFHVLLLDGKHRLLRRQLVSEGTLHSSLVHTP